MSTEVPEMYRNNPALKELSKLPAHVLALELLHMAERAENSSTKNFLHYKFMPDNLALELGVHDLMRQGCRLNEEQRAYLTTHRVDGKCEDDAVGDCLIDFGDDFDFDDEDYGSSIPRLMPALTFSAELSHNLGDDGPLHRLIIGDNYHALAGLQASLATSPDGVYDLTYIDPPYNTGNTDFRYNDAYVDDEDPWRSTKWLSFMETRLILARNLLKRTGVIFIAIGNDEQHTLHNLCDSVFGRRNFIANLVWHGSRLNNSDFVSNGHDYMLVYAKSRAHLDSIKVQWRDSKPGVEEVLEQGARAWKDAGGDETVATAAMQAWFKSRPLNDPVQAMKRYVYFLPDGTLCRDDNISPPGVGPRYDVLHPVTRKPVPVPSRGWLHSTPERMQQDIDAGYVIFRADHTKKISLKRPLEAVTGQVPLSIIARQRTHAKRHLESILGAGSFPFPKDHNELARWFRMAAPKDAKILDFFGGSGSTAEAVLMLNAEDGGTREITIVTNDENGIGTEVTRERIVRVMSGENWADGKEHTPLGGRLGVWKVGVTDAIDFTSTEDEGVHHSWNTEAGKWGAWQNTPILHRADDYYDVYTDGIGAYSLVFHDIDHLRGPLVDTALGEFPDAQVFLPYQHSYKTSRGFYVDDVPNAIPLPLGAVSPIMSGISDSVLTPYTKRGGGSYMDRIAQLTGLSDDERED